MSQPQPKTKINARDQAEMVFVPPGPFLMGGDDRAPNAGPEHSVHLDGYYIYKYPVTVAQYARYCKENDVRMPPRPEWGWRADHPIVNVSWHDASAYCLWAGVSLPTEAEWEKAARGTDGRQYPWGNEWNPEKCRCSKNDWADARSTSPVTSYPDDISPFGAWHMAGNVVEWCEDLYENTTNRVVRGGSWSGKYEGYFRCANRNWFRTEDADFNLGFRCLSTPATSAVRPRIQRRVR